MAKRLVRTFDEAMRLPGGKYRTLDQYAKPVQGVVMHMDCTGKTNALSETPVIGTSGIDPCLAIILDNRGQKSSVIYHNITMDIMTQINRLVGVARTAETQKLLFHLVGCSITEDSEDETNEGNREELQIVIDRINAHPNVELKTFDVLSKPKPLSVAIDTRNGRLIRATGLYRYRVDADHDPNEFFGWEDCEDEFRDFSRLEI